MGERQRYAVEVSYTAEDVAAAARMSADGCPHDGPEIIAGAPMINIAAETTQNPHSEKPSEIKFPAH